VNKKEMEKMKKDPLNYALELAQEASEDEESVLVCKKFSLKYVDLATDQLNEGFTLAEMSLSMMLALISIIKATVIVKQGKDATENHFQ